MNAAATTVEAREAGTPSSESAKNLRQLMPSSELVRINLDDVYVNKAENVRELRSYTEEDILEMASQIEAAGGLLQPIGLARIPDSAQSEHKQFILVWGYRRTLALLHLAEIDPKWKSNVLAQLMDETDTKGATRVVQLIENMARRELNPMEIAISVQEALDDKDCDFKQKDIAILLGRSEANISQLLKLNRLPKAVQDMISTGKLSFSHARVIMETVPETQWTNAATRGASMTFDEFKSEMEREYAGNEEDTGEAGADGKSASQKPAKMLRAGDLQAKYLSFVKERVEKADASAKNITAKDLEQARLDTIQTVLLSQDTSLAKEIAPYLKKLEEEEEQAKANAEAQKAEEKYFRGLVKRVEEILNTPVDPSKPAEARPTLTQAYAQVGKEVATLTAEQRKMLGFELTTNPNDLIQKLATTYQEVLKEREENRKKREEKKKAEAAAATAATPAAPVAAS